MVREVGKPTKDVKKGGEPPPYVEKGEEPTPDRFKELIQTGISDGLDIIKERHPRIGALEETITKNINLRKIRKGLKDYLSGAVGTSPTDEEIIDKIARGIANGTYLNETAKYFVLKKASKEYGKTAKKEYGKTAKILHPIAAFKKWKNPDYFDKLFDSFALVENFMSSGEYERVLPERIKKGIETVKELGFYDVMLDILYSKGILPGRHALYGKGIARKKAKKELEGILGEYKKRVATAILLVLGVGLLAFSAANITGFVIANKLVSANWTISFGFIFLVTGLLVSLLAKRKVTEGRKGRKRKKWN